MHIARRTLFESDSLTVGHVVARASSPECGDIERQSSNVLVFPLAGVFARHEGPHRHVIATPNHAVLLAADTPYRISYPGAIGDRCLTLRFSDAALQQLFPAAAARSRRLALASHTLLPPAVMLARSLLWRRLASARWDRLEAEELAIGLLAAAIRALWRDGRDARPARSARRLQSIELVKEAIALYPERRWSLARLADLTDVSPWHLAHTFREEVGVPIHRYLLRARILKALDSVLDADRELAAIALETGFASHSHFTARFRELFGVTPAQLRRRARAGQAAEVRKIVTARSLAAG